MKKPINQRVEEEILVALTAEAEKSGTKLGDLIDKIFRDYLSSQNGEDRLVKIEQRLERMEKLLLRTAQGALLAADLTGVIVERLIPDHGAEEVDALFNDVKEELKASYEYYK